MNAQTQRSEEFQRQDRRYDLWQECARQLRLMGFSLRQFLTVPYFIQLLIRRYSARSSFRRSPCMRRRRAPRVTPLTRP